MATTDTSFNLQGLLDSLINAGTGALGGYVQGSDMSPWLKGIIGTVLGSPSGQPPFQYGYLPGAQEEYAYKLAKWAARKKGEEERVTPIQQAQTQRMLNLLQTAAPRYQQLYQPTAAEQQLTQYGGNLNDWLQSMWTQDTPAYRERLDRLERERVARTQEDLQDLVSAHERAVARGGVGLLTPERRDEMIARQLARTQDTARDKAHEQVMGDLAKVFSGGVAGFAPQQKLAEMERARQTAGLNVDLQNQMLQERARAGQENLLSDLAGKWEAAEPDMYDVRNKYFWQGPMGTAGVGAGGGAGGGSAGSSILGQLANLGVQGLGKLLSGAGGLVGDLFSGAGDLASSAWDTLSGWFGGGSQPSGTGLQMPNLPDIDIGNIDWNNLFTSGAPSTGLQMPQLPEVDIGNIDWNNLFTSGSNTGGGLNLDNFDLGSWGGNWNW